MKSKTKTLTSAEKAAKLAAIRQFARNNGAGLRPMSSGSMRPSSSKMASTGMRQNSSFRKPGV